LEIYEIRNSVLVIILIKLFSVFVITIMKMKESVCGELFDLLALYIRNVLALMERQVFKKFTYFKKFVDFFIKQHRRCLKYNNYEYYEAGFHVYQRVHWLPLSVTNRSSLGEICYNYKLYYERKEWSRVFAIVLFWVVKR
jgi:hypothetical protein